MTDYYNILEVARDATADEIKTAYRRLVRQYHPDINKDPDAENQIRELNQAYKVLFDPISRQQYDQYGDSRNIGNFSTGPNFSSGYYDKIYRNFNQRIHRKPEEERPHPNPRPGKSIRLRVPISFHNSILGSHQEISFKCDRICPDCQGICSRKGSQPQHCPVCKARGEVIRQKATPFGSFNYPETCSACKGTRWSPAEKCQTCDGNGVVSAKQTLNLEIPAGISHETMIRLNGQGNSGQFGGNAGDLELIILVEPHPEFQRDGANLYLKAKVHYTQALLGGNIEIKTLEGPLTITIPSCTSANKIVTVPGKGVAINGNPQNRGDLLIKIVIEFPNILSPQEQKLLQAIADLPDCSSPRS
ncbi:DnaJ C-terminal domain-containing protein [Leptolyngbya sp. AN03gr2]|uniref:DnaJ C-terminal domain-containing protein n=1 Tax=unclassified Leptolyngbya TaxID=2650499 RepID=UPI003D322F94